ncbi:MAG: DUF72 domain-containing protein [Chloroflexota bacterium]|nr:DUF72 domain-containing protein [Chloroflexota bacterium]
MAGAAAPGENSGVSERLVAPVQVGDAEVRVGISSWNSLPGFYPARTRADDKLPWYARHFPIVEVNTSYYRPVPASTYEKWVTLTPDGFLFDVKAFRDLTHGETLPLDATFAQFRDSLEPLRAAHRFGCALYQFPPSFGNTQTNRDFLRRVAEQMTGIPVAVEFRNGTWLDAESAPDTLALLSDLSLAYAIADEPQLSRGTVQPLVANTSNDLAYLRLHGRNAKGWLGHRGRYDYDYSTDELVGFAETVEQLATSVKQVHVMFNNNEKGAGTRNALVLIGMLRGEAPHTGDLPPVQASLFS